jgi:hypothetical protein
MNAKRLRRLTWRFAKSRFYPVRMLKLRGVAGTAAAVLFASILMPVLPANATTTASFPHSCVDLNNNGICDAGEPALGPLLNAGSFNTSVAQPGYAPPAGPVGVVLDSFPITADGLTINATGNITVNGKMKNPAAAGVDLETGNNIVLSPGAQIQVGQGHCCANGITMFAQNLIIGAKAKIQIGGDFNFWDLGADNVMIGASAKLTAVGDDTEIDVVAANALQFGDGVQLKTSNSGTISVLAQASWAATGLKVTSDTIDLEADSADNLSFAPQRTLSLTNSNINQDASDGSLTISAGTPGFHSSTDQLTFTHTRVRSVAGGADLEPTPVILSSAPKT